MRTDAGLVYFYKMTENTTAGRKPTYTYALFDTLGYENRQIGITRQEVALQQDSRVDALIRTRIRYGLEDCRAILAPYSHADSNVYKVITVREMVDQNGLPCSEIELERLEGIDADEIISAGNEAG